MNQFSTCCLPTLCRLIVILAFALPTTSMFGQDGAKIDFGKQIKPILSDKCFACHGPDKAQRISDFRLDEKQSALDPDYSVIVPSKPDESLLVERILSDDPDEVMPPADHLKSLDESQKKLLVEWIAQGADWSEHWAFRKPASVKVPNVADDQWPTNYIDQFVLAKLESKSIAPSPTAEHHTLLRRLSFDLIGLPPTVEELKQFQTNIESDGLKDSLEKEVDRLLASPHFGERMAVYWLDLVRYADTVGYHGDQNVSVSPYRDYVIDAFNSNLPFDQFTREQLAGDLIDSPTESQRIASGYNRLGMMSAEGGVQPEEYLNKYASDRVRTTASVWLGVTLGCAECHDHKFDPFSTQEFYEFSAFFADIKEKGLYAGSNNTGRWGASIDVVDPILPSLLVPIDAEIARIESTMVENKNVAAFQTEWEASLEQTAMDWQTIQPLEIKTRPKVDTKTLPENSILVSGDNPQQVIYAIDATIPNISKAIRLEVLPHESLPKQGPGRAGNGNFVVTEFMVLKGRHAKKASLLRKPQSQWPAELKLDVVRLANASATIEQSYGGESHPDKKWSAASTIDLDARGKTWGWAVLPDVGQQQELVVQFAKDQQLTSEDVTIVIRQDHRNGAHTLGHFRLSSTPQSNATADPLRSLPEEIRSAIAVAPSDRSDKQQSLVSNHFLSITPKFRKEREKNCRS